MIIQSAMDARTVPDFVVVRCRGKSHLKMVRHYHRAVWEWKRSCQYYMCPDLGIELLVEASFEKNPQTSKF